MRFDYNRIALLSIPAERAGHHACDDDDAQGYGKGFFHRLAVSFQIVKRLVLS